MQGLGRVEIGRCVGGFLLCFLWYYEETYQMVSPVEPTHHVCSIYSASPCNTRISEVVFLNLHEQFNHLPHNKSSSVGLLVTPALGSFCQKGACPSSICVFLYTCQSHRLPLPKVCCLCSWSQRELPKTSLSLTGYSVSLTLTHDPAPPQHTKGLFSGPPQLKDFISHVTINLYLLPLILNG